MGGIFRAERSGSRRARKRLEVRVDDSQSLSGKENAAQGRWSAKKKKDSFKISRTVKGYENRGETAPFLRELLEQAAVAEKGGKREAGKAVVEV